MYALGAAREWQCLQRPVPSLRTQRAGPPVRRQTLQQRRAVRVRVTAETYALQDRIQGLYSQNLASEAGDFVVRRKDRLFAYQLAVVVDDAYQGITDIVRGIDLLDSTPRQLYLQHCLGYGTPRYAHVPIIVDAAGDKLSKQSFAPPLQPERAQRSNSINVLICLVCLHLAH